MGALSSPPGYPTASAIRPGESEASNPPCDRAAAALAQSTVRDCLLVDDATGCVSELVKTFEDVARQVSLFQFSYFSRFD